MNDSKEQIVTSREAVKGVISFSFGESLEFGAELAESKQRKNHTIFSLSVKMSMEYISRIYNTIFGFFQRDYGDSK